MCADTKGMIKIRKSTDRQHNGQKRTDTKTNKTKDRLTQTRTKNKG